MTLSTLGMIVRSSMYERELAATLVGGLGLIALILAGIGIAAGFAAALAAGPLFANLVYGVSSRDPVNLRWRGPTDAPGGVGGLLRARAARYPHRPAPRRPPRVMVRVQSFWTR